MLRGAFLTKENFEGRNLAGGDFCQIDATPHPWGTKKMIL